MSAWLKEADLLQLPIASSLNSAVHWNLIVLHLCQCFNFAPDVHIFFRNLSNLSGRGIIISNVNVSRRKLVSY
uniref:Uncharacterized protein n=1 Tax=Aegilops tauschii subsp. strangulata TaxID=200361 RepID=A0A453MR23_AEGTS